MVKINKLITPYNFTPITNKRNMWVVIHYVGAVSSAKNNALYFYNNDLRGTSRASSANYFVDPKEIWQSVEDYNGAWHIGAYKYYNSARNNNSIGIEMCCKKDAHGKWYIEPQTIENTVQLTAKLLLKYNLDISRCVRHFDCTGKLCPEPLVRDESAWIDFINRVKEAMQNMADVPEISLSDKWNKIKNIMNVDDNTIRYFSYYKWNVPLFDKMYATCVDAEKWRNLQNAQKSAEN